MGYPRHMRARNFKVATRTAGDVVVSSTSLVDVSTALDIALEAQVGDVIEYAINGLWNNEASWGYLDVATIVSAAPVNYFGTGTASGGNSIPGWLGIPSVYTGLSGSDFYTLTAADLSSGSVLLRLRTKFVTVSSSQKTLFATAANPLQVAAKNLGPPDPH